MELVPPTQAALREALSLSEEIIRNIEMMEIPLTNCALKASRLARITNDFDFQKIMGYEASGYPTTPNGVEPAVYQLAVNAQRESQKKDPKTEKISKFISLESIEELERQVSSAQTAIEAARDPNVSVSSSNPNQMVFNPAGNKFERDTIRKQVVDAQRLLSKRTSFIYSYALQKHYELKFSGIADDIFSRIRESVDSAIGNKVPDAAQKLSAVYEALQSKNPENWANAVHSCRRILQDLADSLYPSREDRIVQINGKDKSVKLGKENYINRIISYIEENSDSARYSELVGSDLSPKFHAMNSMRFPANLARWRSRYEEDAIHRRADHWCYQGARGRRQGRRHLPQAQHIQWHVLQLAEQIRRFGSERSETAARAGIREQQTQKAFGRQAA